MKKGDIFEVDLDENDESIQSGERYAIIVSNDKANTYSPVIHIVPTTTQDKSSWLPTHFKIQGFGLPKDSILMAEQTMLVNKKHLKKKVGELDYETLCKVNKIIKVQFGLN